MFRKLNKTQIILIFFVLLVSTSLTYVVLQEFRNNYSIVKISVNKTNGSDTSYKISDEILNFLKSKNISTDLDKDTLEKIYWAERVKEGGLILLFRHSEREKWNNSVEGFDAYELFNKYNARNFSWDKATCLTQKGIEESKLINEAFSHANIEISEVISSPSCRAVETALFAFNKIDKIFSGLLHKTAFHPLDRNKIGEKLKEAVLDLEIKKSKNIILSAHNKVISHHSFIDAMNVGEGLEESGFYIIEKKDDTLTVPFKFSSIKNFIILLYRHEFEKSSYIK